MNWTLNDSLILSNEFVKDLSCKDLKFLISFLCLQLRLKEIRLKIKKGE